MQGVVLGETEAAILELLLHRQWLVQCKSQLYGGSSGPQLNQSVSEK